MTSPDAAFAAFDGDLDATPEGGQVLGLGAGGRDRPRLKYSACSMLDA